MNPMDANLQNTKNLNGSNEATFIIRNAAELEQRAQKLTGPLASAFGGAEGGKPVTGMQLGDLNVVPPEVSRILRLVSWINRRCPRIGILLRKLAARKQVYGGLLTSMLFKVKKPWDKVQITIKDDRRLLSVRVKKRSDQDIEIAVKSENSILQILHFGKPLADGSTKLVIEYRYDKKSGKLYSTGPTKINEQALISKQEISLPEQSLTAEQLEYFAALTKQPALGSLTFTANYGIIGYILKILQEPELAVDFTRLTVHALEFENHNVALLEAGKTIQAKLKDLSVMPTDKGEMLSALLVLNDKDQQICQVKMSVLVRGNLSTAEKTSLPRIPLRNLGGQSQSNSLDMRVMEEQDLIKFASLNQDHNPLHQIDGVAQAVGFRKVINPGLGTIAEIETALRRHFKEQVLAAISGTFIRPVYPGEVYRLEFAPKQDNSEIYNYQLINNKHAKKVLVDGQFSLTKKQG